jgi:hypothetical protein
MEEDWDHELGIDRQESERILKEEWIKTVVTCTLVQKQRSDVTTEQKAITWIDPTMMYVPKEDYEACLQLLQQFLKVSLYATSNDITSSEVLQIMAHPRHYKEIESYIMKLLQSSSSSLDLTLAYSCLVYLGEMYFLDHLPDCAVACYAFAQSWCSAASLNHETMAVLDRIYEHYPHSLKRYQSAFHKS